MDCIFLTHEARMRLRPTPRKPDPLEQLLTEPSFAELPISVCQHSQVLPLGVMVRGTLEWLLADSVLEPLFQEQAPEQYTRELTIANLVNLMVQVSAGARASVFAAYKADQASASPTITTSFQAVYSKLGRINPNASEGLVRFSADKLGLLLELMPGATAPAALPGYRLRVLDGNVLAGSEHRLKPLRKWLNCCLPGKSLVVYEPERGLVTDLVLCEDAYSQERVLLTDLLPRVQPGDLWLADRNFCTTRFVYGLNQRQGHFIVRQHQANLSWEPAGKLQKRGQTDTGTVWEQPVRVTNPETGAELLLRRIELRLFQKTRDGERTIAVLTNLPDSITALSIADLYRKRWTIECHFQFLTESLHCEIPGLGKPRAALFAFAMALVASNALAVVRAGLRAAHGPEAEANTSGYYLADEIEHDYRPLLKYLPPEEWQAWQRLPAKDLARLLIAIAGQVNMKALERSRRGPKKPKTEKPVYNKRHTHYSTSRLLNGTEADDTC
jgi:hypothetical protein